MHRVIDPSPARGGAYYGEGHAILSGIVAICGGVLGLWLTVWQLRRLARAARDGSAKDPRGVPTEEGPELDQAIDRQARNRRRVNQWLFILFGGAAALACLVTAATGHFVLFTPDDTTEAPLGATARGLAGALGVLLVCLCWFTARDLCRPSSKS